MNSKSICILDYGSGNVKSVYNIVTHLGYKAKISNFKKDIIDSSHIILPGVGSFGSSMEKISKSIPFNTLENQVLGKKKPFLGICVGMQVLADKGFEFGEHKGFGWISGEVKKIKIKKMPSIHIGWNNIIIRKDSNFLKGLEEINDFYFVHSYCFEQSTNSKDYVLAETQYEDHFTSIIQKDNIFGVQFHPEKSQIAGQIILKNFININ